MQAAHDKARLRWRCRRGMRELDLLLSAWLDNQYGRADAADRDAFCRLLEESDPQLLVWLTGRSYPHDPDYRRVIDAIRAGH